MGRVTSWATYAARAGLDRLAVPGRGLDPGFVTELEVDVIETVRQTGGDVHAALDGVHEGLEWARAGACPECGARGRHGRHSAACAGPWGLYGPDQREEGLGVEPAQTEGQHPTPRTCAVDGCEKRTRYKKPGSVCDMHARRMERRGTYDRPTPEQEFWAKVDQSAGPDACWPWTGHLEVSGYGRTRLYRVRYSAHRLAYILTNGSIPEGLVLDHTCHNGSGCAGGDTCPHRRCANPGHLEPVTPGVNTLRGESPSATASRRETCPEGHPYDTEYRRTDGTGVDRGCKRCKAAHSRRYLRSRKESESTAGPYGPLGPGVVIPLPEAS